MKDKPIPPRTPLASMYGIDPALLKKRGADLPGICSLRVTDVFPDQPEVIYPGEKGIAAIREETERMMARVDLSKIRPGDSVNVLCSHHGFTLLGGEPYAEMLRTIRDVVAKRTGCSRISLRVGQGLRYREGEDYIRRFKLDASFTTAVAIAPIDKGIPIETEIGTLYGIKKAYDADWIIHTHNSDVREIHFHRMVDRAVKPFAMSYARLETRSGYHQNLGPRAANFMARAIFDSDFVQRKYVFSAFLMVAPSGIVTVDCDNDMYLLNDRVVIAGMKYYGKIVTLLGSIDACIAVLDSPAPVPYVFAGGLIYGNFLGARHDLFDLEKPLPSYTFYTEAYYGHGERHLTKHVPGINPAVKMTLHNYAFIGYPSEFFAAKVPTIMVGREQADLFRHDPQSTGYMRHAVIADDLEAALEYAKRISGTDKVLIFDGAIGGINMSESLADHFLEMAPDVSRRVDEVLLPLWLRQRGMDPAVLAAWSTRRYPLAAA
ncbi:MAG: hypothetical protein HY644_03365 [Acidobacteria bacterium]|nr:hypothetical protein [Acidobacteriota bacterium]